MIREEIILKHIEGKDVLDIGSVSQSLEYYHTRSSRYYHLWDLMMTKGKAKSLTGIDVLPSKGTPIVNGTKIVQGDMETYDLKRKFDIAIAGDVIEHVHNQGLFLDSIHKHLIDGGELIITTPNIK